MDTVDTDQSLNDIMKLAWDTEFGHGGHGGHERRAGFLNQFLSRGIIRPVRNLEE